MQAHRPEQATAPCLSEYHREGISCKAAKARAAQPAARLGDSQLHAHILAEW